MLAFQPYQRLSLVDVIVHPFFKEGAPMATKEEVKAFMGARREIIRKASKTAASQ